MTGPELRGVGALASVFATRLLGLFMIYPVFSAYAQGLGGATPFLVGLTLGIYGLTQALLQIPFGWLSDRVGRKSVITLGLLVFAAGSVVAATSHTIAGVLVGRALQGGGAVGSAILAFVADVTREEVRTRAMAIVGMTIGLAFLVSIVLGPPLAQLAGVRGIFWLTAVLALVGIGLAQAPATPSTSSGTQPAARLFARVLRNRDLLRLDFSIFALHAILTSSFLVVPPLIKHDLKIPAGDQWIVYLPVLAVSVAVMIPAVIAAEKYSRVKAVFVGSVAFLAASLAALALAGAQSVVLFLALAGFFSAFNVMESLLPSLVSKIAPAEAKGAAIGIYSSSQFLGIFFGGAVGGWALGRGGSSAVFAFSLIVALVWLAASLPMRLPRRRPGAQAPSHPTPSRETEPYRAIR